MTQDDDSEDLGGEYRRETFNDEVTDIEKEDTGEPPPDAKPWDPSKIRISTKPFSLRQIVDMITDGDIDLAPDFQRMSVWNDQQRSKLIESILLSIPLPAFYFNQDQAGAMQVVDGVQRLTTIRDFVNGKSLSGLEYLKSLETKRFKDLEPVQRRRFQQTQIFVHVIEPQTPDIVKFDVFRRINTGGSPLTAQEIRHCMSRTRTRELLKKLVEMPSFRKATDDAFKNERRMADREVALRFCAFRHLKTIDEYRVFQSVDAFLLDFVRQLDGTHPDKPQLTENELTRLHDDFERAMCNAVAIFGNAAFRKYPTGAKRRGPLNRALFESWAVALANHDTSQLEPRKDLLMQAARKTMANSAYNEAISQGTGDYSKVKLRFRTASDIIQQALK